MTKQLVQTVSMMGKGSVDVPLTVAQFANDVIPAEEMIDDNYPTVEAIKQMQADAIEGMRIAYEMAESHADKLLIGVSIMEAAFNALDSMGYAIHVDRDRDVMELWKVDEA